MSRTSLPNRRPNLTADTVWNSHAITVTLGYHPKTGRVAEIFADTERPGQMQADIRAACILASQCLQLGATPADLLKSMERVQDYSGAESYASAIGAILATIIGEAA